MDRKFEPVMISGATPSLPAQTAGTAVDSQPCAAQYLLAARAVDAADDRRRARSACSSTSSRLFKAAPIMTPLLMFGVMIGSLFVVTRLRNSAWGVLALFGFTFIAGLMLTPILTVAAGFRNGGQLVALAGGMTAAIFFAMAAYRHGDEAGLRLHGQVPVRRPDPADRRVARQPVLPDPGALGDDLGDRGADLLARTSCTTSPTSCAAARRTTSWPR